jgi:N-acetylmuramoyl-L-alanine amidase|tara:strand:- start:2235 stop:2681 length:447 start_codon:yes stop_codon:yes gene_type:complete
MAKRNKTEYLIIHCTATKPSMDIGLTEVDAWHRHRGFFGCGYQFIIRRDGVVENGRSIGDVGAHAKGYNHNSIGIALVGGVTEDDVSISENNFTEIQFDVLSDVITTLQLSYGDIQVLGHRDLPDVKKDCPAFDVKEWLHDVGEWLPK